MGCKNHPQVIPPAMTLPTTRSSAVGNATTAHPPDPAPPRDPAAARSEKDASGSRSGGRPGISRWSHGVSHMFGHVPNGKCTQRNRMQTGWSMAKLCLIIAFAPSVSVDASHILPHISIHAYRHRVVCCRQSTFLLGVFRVLIFSHTNINYAV